MHPTIGVITVGQTPRVDMIPAMQHIFPDNTAIVERGVLDYKTEQEILNLSPNENQTVLVSRLSNGDKTVIAKEKILPFIQDLISELNLSGTTMILLACTGQFPKFTSNVPLIYPDYLLNHVVKGVIQEGTLGVIVPLPEQKDSIIKKWETIGLTAIPKACSPYNFNKSELIKVASELEKLPIKAIVLDCMGYTEEMKSIVQENTSKMVFLARNVIYQNMAELTSFQNE
ncbi:AroM family protein [Oceanobacillus sp. FSL W8-0428]|uniref:AroM family protein n=1 Tax=Oceanobacillus TaxID=182709 RepID=UPI0030D8B2B3